ncbi:MAG: hypothetical protein HQK77_11710 [Desulfobacterales bacterium]|nr:hypothetical protein [Desulfobacterales bacterium]
MDSGSLPKILENPQPYLFIAALLSQLNQSAAHKLFIILSQYNEYHADHFTDVIEKHVKQASIQKACQLSDLWMKKQVNVCISSLNLGDGDHQVFFGYGNWDNLKANRACVISSRKHKTINPKDAWIHTTYEAVQFLIQESYSLVTSLGNYAYELSAYTGIASNGKVIFILDTLLPIMQTRSVFQSFMDKYKEFIDPKNALLLSPFPYTPFINRHDRYRYRDELVIELSDMIIAIDIRKGGNMESLISKTLQQRHPKVKVFITQSNVKEVEHLLELGAKPCRFGEDILDYYNHKLGLNPYKNIKLDTEIDLDGDYLIHFTRSCQGPWPGQSVFEYYKSLVNKHDNAEHTACDTLKRILDERLIRASTKLIRGNIPCISFTECKLKDIFNLILWRKGLIRWTFEPYGIAIDKEVLTTLGAMPAIYGNETDWKKLSDEQKFRFQLNKSSAGDWSTEKEWRFPLDLNLKAIPDDKIRIIVQFKEEASYIRNDYNVIALKCSR